MFCPNALKSRWRRRLYRWLGNSATRTLWRRMKEAMNIESGQLETRDPTVTKSKSVHELNPKLPYSLSHSAVMPPQMHPHKVTLESKRKKFISAATKCTLPHTAEITTVFVCVMNATPATQKNTEKTLLIRRIVDAYTFTLAPTRRYDVILMYSKQKTNNDERTDLRSIDPLVQAAGADQYICTYTIYPRLVATHYN